VIVFCELLNRCIAIIELTNQFGKVKEDIGVFHIYLSSTGHEYCSEENKMCLGSFLRTNFTMLDFTKFHCILEDLMKFIFEHSINMKSNILTNSNNDSCKVRIGHIQSYPMASTTTCLDGRKGLLPAPALVIVPWQHSCKLHRIGGK
jgi:hypothetical protein